MARVIHTVSPRRRREVIDALRRGTVPANGLDLLAVGLDQFGPALDAELDAVAGGSAVFKAVRGEYGSGKTFFTRHLAERALRRGWATAEVQVSETETPAAPPGDCVPADHRVAADRHGAAERVPVGAGRLAVHPGVGRRRGRPDAGGGVRRSTHGGGGSPAGIPAGCGVEQDAGVRSGAARLPGGVPGR